MIGRHSRPEPRKWPAPADKVRAAYSVDRSVRVRILGGTDAAVDVLRELPEQWEALPFGAVSPREFLDGLDAFVYFHHPDLIEAFGRTILEAIAAGWRPPTSSRCSVRRACTQPPKHRRCHRAHALVADPEAYRRHVERAHDIARGDSATTLTSPD